MIHNLSTKDQLVFCRTAELNLKQHNNFVNKFHKHRNSFKTGKQIFDKFRL